LGDTAGVRTYVAYGTPEVIRKEPGGRSAAIDLLRGIVMVLMTLDHTRDFFTDAPFDPLDLSRTSPALFFTRWVTHFCAPIFVFLAGTGAFLYGAGGRTKGQVSFFLFSRGLWLVLLEFTLVHLGWFFNFQYQIVIAQVIWAIGWSMVALAALVFLPAWAVTLLGAVVVAGHNVLDALVPTGEPTPTWMVLAQLRPGLIRLGAGFPVLFQGYPFLPWLGIMALGYGFGAIWRSGHRRRAITAALGLLAVALFVTLRWSGMYGNPQPWSRQAEGWATALAFLDCSKYPPSLTYVLMTLGPGLLVLALADRPLGAVGRVFVAFGRVPLFFYLLHVPLIHLAALGAAYVRHGHAAFLLTHPQLGGNSEFPANYGYGLPGVYLATVVVLMILYPLCYWYGELKRKHPSIWLSFL
jgi:uncharacterized membrane protein